MISGPGPALTLERAVQVYLSGRPSPHTQRNYAARLRRFMQWYGEQPPGPFVALLREYISTLEREGLAPRSVQAHVNTIKGLLRMAAALDETGVLAGALPQLSLATPPAVKGELQGDRLGERQRQADHAPGTDPQGSDARSWRCCRCWGCAARNSATD
jgi:hypothetical protein